MSKFPMYEDFTGFRRQLPKNSELVNHELMHFPPINISQDEKNVYVRALTPGVQIKAMSLTLGDCLLTIEGDVPLPEGKYLRKERHSGPFRRTVPLPAPVRQDEATANLRDGVLKVLLPKLHPDRIIPIKHHKV